MDTVPRRDHLPEGLVVSTRVSADKHDSVPTEKTLNCFIFFCNGIKRNIIISGNMD